NTTPRISARINLGGSQRLKKVYPKVFYRREKFRGRTRGVPLSNRNTPLRSSARINLGGSQRLKKVVSESILPLRKINRK
ncbi:MAG TPA: hypothetical protein VEW65_01545, partial [Chryseolinea sp.]|nr:hypothetical protein [Chryseolinea sp.]